MISFLKSGTIQTDVFRLQYKEVIINSKLMKDRDSKIDKFIFITTFQIHSKLHALLKSKTPSTGSCTLYIISPISNNFTSKLS